jgi:hypothetical protein
MDDRKVMPFLHELSFLRKAHITLHEGWFSLHSDLNLQQKKNERN